MVHTVRTFVFDGAGYSNVADALVERGHDVRMVFSSKAAVCGGCAQEGDPLTRTDDARQQQQTPQL